MDLLTDPCSVLAFSMWIILLLLNAEAIAYTSIPMEVDELDNEDFPMLLQFDEVPPQLQVGTLQSTFFNFQLCTALNMFDDEIAYWVKPRSTTWFSVFLMERYDESRWISMFRMSKAAILSLAEVIRPHVQKRDTRYRRAMPVLVQLACTLFKLTHAANLTVCSEMFAIGTSIVSKILREVVHAINDYFKHELRWPSGDALLETQRKFANLCMLPSVVGAFDGVHFPISKPQYSPSNYYYFKTRGYSMNAQAVVDSEQHFLYLYVGMPSSTNDSRMLRRSSLYRLATQGHLLSEEESMEGFTPYIIADSAYPLLPWLIVPHRDGWHLSVSERLLNKKLRKGRCVVEKAFGILKQSFRELLHKSDLHVAFYPDVVMCCILLHNILLRQSHEDVEQLLQVLEVEGMSTTDGTNIINGGRHGIQHGGIAFETAAMQKRHELGEYLLDRVR